MCERNNSLVNQKTEPKQKKFEEEREAGLPQPR